ncbi:hypothetical protein [Streptosporangium subroseum]|uniref:hypothetical protein n=1 Tax=Streptosporangium subroseum TaxID=106412 RepID=UPI00308D0130|nr:hypothetical protein OHB15_14680 [Streptosporangium subroseum]
MPAVAPGTGPLAPEFNGIDPALMQGFITDLEQAGQVIAEHTEAIRRELAAVGLPAAGLAPVREIGGWAEEQLPRLRQRVETITAAPAVLLGGGLAGYQESALPAPAEAQKQGSDLGKRFADIDLDEFSLLGPYASDRMAALVDDLKAHQHDSNFTAAFFTALGPAGTRMISEQLRRLPNDEEAIRIAGTAFATAVAGGAKVPGFSAVMKAVEKVDSLDDIADLLSHGRYPAEWLVGIAAPALATDSRVGGSTLGKLLNALGNNPTAARLAINSVTDLSPAPASVKFPFGTLPGSPQTWKARPELVAFLKTLNERTNGMPETASGFGRLLAAASGAYDEPQGKHSREAAFFAYTVMTTADDLDLGDAARPHLSEIAGAYATEITLGANIGDADMTKDSLLQPTPGFFEPTTVPGLRGAFRLSPEDTFRFLTTFTGTPQGRAPFEAGMSQLIERLLPEASRQAQSNKDVTALDNLFTALGNVRGFELAAAVRVLKPMDESVKNAQDAESLILGTAMGVIGLISPFSAIARTWTALSTGVAVNDTYSPDTEEESARLLELDDAETLGRQYTVAQLLVKQGFTIKVPPAQISNGQGALIVDKKGNLLPFLDIANKGEVALKALDQWYIDNGMGSGNKVSMGDLSRLQADNFDGRKQPALRRASAYRAKLTTD